MTPCALCAADSRESALAFHHVRKAERVALEVALCGACGDRVEKHLKRAIPKRLMQFSALRGLTEAAGARAASPAAAARSPRKGASTDR